MPAFDGGDDFVGISGPDEGLWVGILVDEEAIEGGLKVQSEWNAPRFRRLLVSVAKKPSTAI